jgi:hypothetical protein
MYDSPAYVWAIIIAGPAAIAATTCIALYGGAKRAGLGRRRAALLAGATATSPWASSSRARCAGTGLSRPVTPGPSAVRPASTIASSAPPGDQG